MFQPQAGTFALAFGSTRQVTQCASEKWCTPETLDREATSAVRKNRQVAIGWSYLVLCRPAPRFVPSAAEFFLSVARELAS